ncbi:MAG: carbamoyl phosphate synthase small subunit [Firmicutes bacterium]|nr:carbamoyl phosphate synthase small subunit [Bacillota bacterium]
MKGYLVLEDGTVFQGEAFGAPGLKPGEVVFATGMTGYQEALTDPSYCGQILVMTYPLVGNCGINPEDFEARRPYVRGLVVRELCTDPSHWQATQALHEYLADQGIPGLAEIDTRALTRHLRIHGTLRGVIATPGVGDAPAGAGSDLGAPGGLVRLGGAGWAVPVPPALAGWFDDLAAMARGFSLTGVIAQVTTPQPYTVEGGGRGPRVAVIDLGVKASLLRCLLDRGCRQVTVVPATATPAEIRALEPDGVLISSGPGDPREAGAAIETVRELLQTDLPLFGICLGHQVLALALGAQTYRMKFGHRGTNHPVKDLTTGRVYITAQNHGYAVDEASLPRGVVVTHRNLSDGTVEGLALPGRPVFSVQYHPEAGPGPEDSRYLFDRFIGYMQEAGLRSA